jgi:hypothetical protein
MLLGYGNDLSLVDIENNINQILVENKCFMNI